MKSLDKLTDNAKLINRTVSAEDIYFASNYLSGSELDGSFHPENVSIVSRIGERIKAR